MTTSVSHNVLVGFQMGSVGAGLGMSAQTSKYRVQLTHLTHGDKHLVFFIVSIFIFSFFILHLQEGDKRSDRVARIQTLQTTNETVALYDVKICKQTPTWFLSHLTAIFYLNKQTLQARGWIQFTFSTNVLI